MLKKDIKAIEKTYLEERKCGHTICDFDDYNHDLKEIAEVIDVDMIEDEDEFGFKTKKDKTRVEEALKYYYELHSC